MPSYNLPDSDQLASMLTNLFGRDVAVKEGAPLPETKNPVGIYRSAEGQIGVVCICDMHFANFTGAALSLIPAGMAKENARKGSIPDNIRENFYEILNICSSLFRTPLRSRISLNDVEYNGATVAEAKAILSEPAARLDYVINIPGYGPGKISMASANLEI